MANVHSLSKAKVVRGPRIMHSPKQKMAFWELLHAQFTSSGKTDEQFAKFATETLGFEINDNHVMHARLEFGIAACKPKHAKPKTEKSVLAARVTALERLVDAMRAELGMPVADRS